MTRPTRLAALLVLLVAPTARGADDPDAPAEVKAAAKAANDRKKAIQTELGKDAVGRYVRVDGFEAGKERVEAVGVVLEPVRSAAEAKEADLDELVLKALATAVLGKDAEKLQVGAGRLRKVAFAAQPHVVLQKRAVAAGGAADRLVVTGGTFDADGKLVLAGKMAADGPKAWLTAEAAKLPGEKEFDWLKGADRLITAGVMTVEWGCTPAALQAVLAADKAATATRGRVRVDRVYPEYKEADKQLQLNLTGVWLAGGDDEAIEKAVDGAARGAWKGIGQDDVLVRTKEILKPEAQVKEPEKVLQPAVAGAGELDGTRVAPGALFASTGELALTGVRPTFDDPSREAAWRTALTTRLTAASREAAAAGGERGEGLAKLLDRGVTTTALAPLPSQQILAQLKVLAAREDEYLEDVMLKRLAFDPDGRLKLDGHFVRDIDRDRVADALRQSVGKHLPVVPAEPKPKEGVAPAGVTLEEKGLQPIPGVTAHLKSVLRSDRKTWYGVVLRRGYFETDGKYTVVGVVDQPEQQKAFAKLMEATRADDRWKGVLTEEPTAKLDLFTMKRLLDRAQRVAPAYPACDGVALQGVGYDDADNLVFDVAVVGSGRTGTAQETLRALLAASPDYGRRLPRNVVPAAGTPGGRQVVPARVVFRPTTAAVAPSQAIGSDTGPITGGLVGKFVVPPPPSKEADDTAAARARRLLDNALLHAPDESGLWYLSAYLHFRANDAELTRRDLYRVVGVEGITVSQTDSVFLRRHDVSSGVQGPTRFVLDEQLARSRRELANGARPIGFDPAP